MEYKMFCNKCGYDMGDDKFCRKCGAVRFVAEKNPTSDHYESDIKFGGDTIITKRRPRLLMIAVGIVTVIIIIATVAQSGASTTNNAPYNQQTDGVSYEQLGEDEIFYLQVYNDTYEALSRGSSPDFSQYVVSGMIQRYGNLLNRAAGEATADYGTQSYGQSISYGRCAEVIQSIQNSL
jgi:hypothetical protein